MAKSFDYEQFYFFSKSDSFATAVDSAVLFFLIDSALGYESDVEVLRVLPSFEHSQRRR